MRCQEIHKQIIIKSQNILIKAHTILTHKALEVMEKCGISHGEERSLEEHYISETDDDENKSDSYDDGGRLRHSFVKRQWEEFDRQNLYSSSDR